MKTSGTRLRRMAWSIAVSAFALPLHAVDGVVLINQNAALAGNVTPGDAPGFPVTISLSGSYRLSGNLVVPDANTTAIEITAADVTIDLNGFSVIGPTVCTGMLVTVTSCSPTGFGSGIVSSRPNVNVFNGTIRGMGLRGIDLAIAGHRVEKIQAVSNGLDGMSVNNGSVLSCDASNNGSTGISADIAIGNTVTGNRGVGIFVNHLAVNNSANFNGAAGIISFGGATISGNTANFNGSQGISATCPSTVVSNTATNNTGGDIFTSGSGCTRANNTPAP